MRLFAASVITLISLAQWACALTWHGADFSSLANLEKGGLSYKDNGATTKFETILKNHGVNLARIRVWTSTNDAQYSLNYGLALAKRAQAAGMQIMVDFHYSDTWADPGKQGIPSGWPTDLNGLNSKIYTYTQSVVQAFKNQGTTPTFVQIGNEVNDGILWPTGRISVNGYSPLSQLLHSAANGVRAASSSTKVVLHLANGWDSGAVTSFYNQIFIPGQLAASDLNVLGFSFYPFYGTSATLNNLKSSLQNIVNKLGKDVMVVETDWPAVCSGVSLSEPSITASASGQTTFVGKVRDVVSSISGGHGLGIIYWEPGWVGNANLGSPCADALLVDGSGNTRSSINLFSSSM